MRLPDRRKRPKMGAREPIQKIWLRHRRWAKSHGCCVPECPALSVDFAHLRSAANAGTGQTPHDIFGISLCRVHHDEQHRIGADAFNKKYGIDLWARSEEHTSELQSPCNLVCRLLLEKKKGVEFRVPAKNKIAIAARVDARIVLSDHYMPALITCRVTGSDRLGNAAATRTHLCLCPTD